MKGEGPVVKLHYKTLNIEKIDMINEKSRFSHCGRAWLVSVILLLIEKI